MLRFPALALALACAAGAAFSQPTFQQQRMMDRSMNAPTFGSLWKMRVYLKGQTGTPPLDSFHLSSDKAALWRSENENAVLFRGKTLEYRPDQIDSVVLEDGRKGIPRWGFLLFQNYRGAINYFGRIPADSTAMPDFIQKGSGELLTPGLTRIRTLVEGDPEATRWMDRYDERGWWKTGIAALGVGMFVGGVAWTGATSSKDENGRQKHGSVGGAVLGLSGAVVFAAPWLGWFNPIWAVMPKKALDTYNRNHRSAP